MDTPSAAPTLPPCPSSLWLGPCLIKNLPGPPFVVEATFLRL